MTKKQSQKRFNAKLIPIFLVLVIVPLLVHLKIVPTPAGSIPWTYTDSSAADLFAYYKGALLLIASAIALCVMIYMYSKHQLSLHKEIPNYFIFAYLFFVILATIFSINKHVSLIGYNERYENVFILFAYIIMMFYAYSVVVQESDITFLVNGWIVASLIMFAIGLGQFFGHDFFTSGFGKNLIVSSVTGSNFTISEDSDTTRTVYQTLYHYNYVSFYAGMAFPFFLSLGLLTSKIRYKVLYLLMALVFLINQIISLSRNGFIGIIAGLFFLILFFHNKWLKFWKFLIPLFIIVIGVGSYFVATSNSLYVTRFTQAINEALNPVEYTLNDIRVEDDTVVIDDDATPFVIHYNQSNSDSLDGYYFTDSDGNILPISHNEDASNYSIVVNGSTITLQLAQDENSVLYLLFTLDNEQWVLRYTDEGFKFMNPGNQLITLEDADSIGFEGYEHFGSERGYIWSRALPLIGERLIGYGPDTFALAFPQDDLVAKHNAYGTSKMLVDKAHDLYIGIAVNTGIFSLIALLIFWGIYFVQSCRLYFKNNFESFESKVGVSCFLAFVGYLASGLFNDSTVNVTPTFWILLGIGLSMNHLVKSQIKAHKR